jgi:2-polyprenyl-3-methyl-5-hydroxy-6-metoxy-1,4-benzoquinol methylase
MNKGDLVLQARTGKRHDKDRTIENYCKDKTVLDVGCIGQDRNFKEPNWLHNKVKGWSKEVDGVDILIEQINELKRNGYNMYSIQELQALKKTYEVVLMADVIEHVDNPVDFMKLY